MMLYFHDPPERLMIVCRADVMGGGHMFPGVVLMGVEVFFSDLKYIPIILGLLSGPLKRRVIELHFTLAVRQGHIMMP